MKRFGLMLIVFGLLAPSFVLAQVPTTISYQGRLDSAGVPIKSPKNLTFAIYSAATGGTAIWTEAQSSVAFTNGMFSVKLGSVTPFPATLFTSAGERWLGVALTGGAEMTPRFQFTSSPFAFRSQQADNIADDAVTSAKVVDGAIATADLADNSVTGIKMVDGTIGTADLADNSVTSIKIANGTITTGDLADQSIITTKIANAAVTFPQIADGSVTAVKVVDEPGIEYLENGGYATMSTSQTACQVASLIVTAPAAGYVMLTASGSLHFTVAGDNMVRVKVSMTSSDIVEAAGLQFVRLPAGVANDMMPFSVSRVFPVAAGANTFYLNIWHQLAPGIGYWQVFTMIGQYFPTRY